MKILEFIKYLSKKRYTVYKTIDGKSYSVFSGKLFLGDLQPDKGNIVFWFNDNCTSPARDFMLDGLNTTEMRIYYPYIHIFVIKGFKHVYTSE